MSGRSYILATAGHVDHGKSALVTALSGVDPDRLPEEKARGITIDLGFAHLPLEWKEHRAAAPVRLEVGLIDVPGHEDFVKNMVAGVGSVDAALLVVAADDGWMPQTQEHVQILSYLGVRRAVVALTKADLAQDVDGCAQAVRQRLAPTPFASAPIVPTSIRSGQGIDALREALGKMLAAAEPREDLHKPRLMVDRAFLLRGVGTIVTGTLGGGSLARGQAVVVQPAGHAARVRSLQTHRREVESAPPGSRVALNLPGFTPSQHRQSESDLAVARGDTVTIAGVGGAFCKVDAMLLAPLAAAADEEPARDYAGWLRPGVQVRLHHGSGAILARVRILRGGGEQPPFIRLLLERPLCALAGDRFILRDAAERRTLAGGIVLDVAPPTFSRRRAAQLELLAARAARPTDPAAFIASALARDGVVSLQTLHAQTPFSREQLLKSAADQSAGALHLGDQLIDRALLRSLREQALLAIGDFHRVHPERPGLPLADLRQALLQGPQAKRSAREVILSAVIEDLCRDGCSRSDAVIRLAEHRPSLPPRLQKAGERIRTILQKHPHDPPARKEIAPDDLALSALKFLIAAGEVIEAGPEIVLSAAAYRQAADIIRRHILTCGPATVSELKSLLNSSRRVMVPLLEKLDRDGITRREGDRRALR